MLVVTRPGKFFFRGHFKIVSIFRVLFKEVGKRQDVINIGDIRGQCGNEATKYQASRPSLKRVDQQVV